MTGHDAALVGELVARIVADLPTQARALANVPGMLTAEEQSDLAGYLRHCGKRGVGLDRLSEAYRVISADTMREQIHFRRHGRYRYSSFAEVSDKVYFDPAYMTDYMYGLALTQYLWPNHLQIWRYFRSSLARARGGRYFEVGPGHGAYFLQALRSRKFASCLGVDISPTSLALTRELLENEPDHAGRWELVESDFLELSPPTAGFDAVVMGEVLEHVEAPERFLAKIFELLNPAGFAFVTTAVNAPAVDHIYLYRSVDEVISMARNAGFTVVDILATPYPGCTMADTVAQALPINVAMVLSK